MKKIAILQSNYLPWKGVFDLIHRVDIFVFLEDVQYTERDWRNRNKILTSQGPQWFSVPVKSSNRRNQLICEAEIDNETNWQRKHYNMFQINYGKSLHFKQYKWIIDDLYLNQKWEKISDLNIYSTKLIASVLGLDIQFINSAELNTSGTKDDKLIEICKKVNADYYLSGPAARDYIVPQKFIDNNIILDYIDYQYPEYQQLHQPFNNFVTILDLIFNCGQEAPYYIWDWRESGNGEGERSYP